MKNRFHSSVLTKRVTTVVLYLLVVGALMFSLSRHFNRPIGGDEHFYVSQAEYLRSNGLAKSIMTGSPVGFSYPILLMNWMVRGSLLTSARVLTLLSVIPLLLGLWFISKRLFRLRSWPRHFINMFSLQVLIGSGFIFAAYADIFFSALMVWALVFLWRLGREGVRWWVPIVAGILLSLALLTRPLALLFLPGILLWMVVTALTLTDSVRRERYIWSIVIMVGTFVGLYCLVQSPNLVAGRGFVFENKDPSTLVTWIRRQTLTQLRYDDGTLPEGHHVSWDELETYLNEHGDDALPNGVLERAMWRPGLVIREFTEDLFISSQYSFLRRTGVLYLLPFLFLLVGRKYAMTRKRMIFILIVVLPYVVGVSAITLTNVEWRWFILPILLTISAGTASLEYMSRDRPEFVTFMYVISIVVLLVSLPIDVRNLAIGRGRGRIFSQNMRHVERCLLDRREGLIRSVPSRYL